MGSITYEDMKKELFLAYEAEIEALVEGCQSHSNEAPNADDKNNEDDEECDAALARRLPEHLKLSYARQRIMCQRAAVVASRKLPLRGPRTAPPPTAANGKDDHGDASQAASAPEEGEEYVVVPESQPGWLRNQMHRAQAESVATLQAAALERQAYLKSKSSREAGDTAEARPISSDEVYDIIARGGVHSEAFYSQRMAILHRMEVDCGKRAIEHLAMETNVD